MRALRIGINALYLIPGEVGGTEIYLRSLLNAIGEVDKTNSYFIYVNAEAAAQPFDDAPRSHAIHCRVRGRLRPCRILYEQLVLPGLLIRDKIDVLLNPGFTSPALFFRPSVTVFHDLQHKRHPEFFRWYDLPFWNLLLWVSAVRSKILIAVSQATASDIARYYPWASSRTVTIPHGVDPEFFRIGARRHAQDTERKYLLTVSTLHPHKNLNRLLEAFQIFRTSHPEYRLVVAGLKGFASATLEALRTKLNLDNAVVFTGWIPREELYELFEFASGYVAPSIFEGFGMPIAEALAAGIPSACSDISPLNEIAGDAVIFFDPESVPEIARAMEIVAVDAEFRTRARTSGPARARLFDWERAAIATVETLTRSSRPGVLQTLLIP